MPEQAGVVLDYTEFDYGPTLRRTLYFKSDTTYYINGCVRLSKTPVFEGGTVLKFNLDRIATPKLWRLPLRVQRKSLSPCGLHFLGRRQRRGHDRGQFGKSGASDTAYI